MVSLSNINETIELIKDLREIVVALIGLISVTLVAYIKQYGARKIKEKELERDVAVKAAKKVKVELEALTLFFSYDFYEFMDEKVTDIFKQTKASRFLILFAINGKEDFNTATVAYEHTKDSRSQGAIRRYVRLPIDMHYKLILKETERYGVIDISVDELPKDSLLYKIYTSKEEQVKYSRLKFISRLHIDDDNDLILYASIGTHEDKPFNDEELYRIDLAVNGIRAKAKNIKIE